MPDFFVFSPVLSVVSLPPILRNVVPTGAFRIFATGESNRTYPQRKSERLSPILCYRRLVGRRGWGHCSPSRRRAGQTLPGMMLLFPGRGMPISSVPFDGGEMPASGAREETGSPPAASTAAAVARGFGLLGLASEEEILRQHYLGGEPRGAHAAERSPAFGDLFVETSITLPSGERMGYPESSWKL